MLEEQWRAVPGYEGRYEVSSLGRVRSLDRICEGKDGRSELHKGKVLKPCPKVNGYLEVSLRDGKSRKHRLIHHLVAAAFLGPRPDRLDVRHADGNRKNNAVENLSYGTRSENLRDCYRYGGRKGNGKLFADDVVDIKRRLEKGESPVNLAEEYGVNSAAIYHIRSGKTFGYISAEGGAF